MTPLTAAISPVAPTSMVNRAYAAASPTRVSFAESASTFAAATLNTLRQSEVTSAKGAAGTASVQDVVEAITKAETSLSTALAIRDRVVSAYQDVLRMNV